MLDDVRRALASFPEDAERLIVALPAPDVDAVAIAREASFVWDDPREGSKLEAVAWGAAVTLEAEGPSRFDDVRARAEAIVATTRVAVVDGLEPRPARFFGGLAFLDRDRRDEPWRDFASASFVLPEATYVKERGRARLEVVVDRRARARGEALVRDALARLEGARIPPLAPAVSVASEGTSAEAWRAAIEGALDHVARGDFEKVVPVLGRHVRADRTLDPIAALAQLRTTYAECARFAARRGEATFLGASPERLFARVGPRVLGDALAGTAPRSSDDEAGARALLASDKDRREHEVVVRTIAAELEALGGRVSAPSSPRVRSLRNVHHLHTPIAATFDVAPHALVIARALHPTPAVCGAPRDAARAWIAERESRGWYTGAVGWFDAQGDGAFAVAIRAGVVRGEDAWLWAGAGVVAGSLADHELAECELKLRPMLGALGLGP